MGYEITATLIEQCIEHSNKFTIEHQIFTTPIIIKLLRNKNELNNEITTNIVNYS